MSANPTGQGHLRFLVAHSSVRAKFFGREKMYGFRELDIGVLTVSVAVAASCVADCGEGAAFSVLSSAGGCISGMCIYRLPRWRMRARSPKGEAGHSNVIRLAADDSRRGLSDSRSMVGTRPR